MSSIVRITKEDWQVIQSMAPVATASRMFGVTQEQAAITMATGLELGFGMAGSFRYIYPIDNKPSLSSQAMLALCQRSGLLEDLKVEHSHDDAGNVTGCTVTVKRLNSYSITQSFTVEDAKRADLLKKSNWKSYPDDMLQWRAMAKALRLGFADVVGGLYTPDELGLTTNQFGEPIEAEIIEAQITHSNTVAGYKAGYAVSGKELPPDQDVKTQSAPRSVSEPVEEKSSEPLTLDMLRDMGYTPEQIMQANNMNIPFTTDECEAVLAKLEGRDA